MSIHRLNGCSFSYYSCNAAESIKDDIGLQLFCYPVRLFKVESFYLAMASTVLLYIWDKYIISALIDHLHDQEDFL